MKKKLWPKYDLGTGMEIPIFTSYSLGFQQKIRKRYEFIRIPNIS